MHSGRVYLLSTASEKFKAQEKFFLDKQLRRLYRESSSFDKTQERLSS
jgi:hypothetical protein